MRQIEPASIVTGGVVAGTPAAIIKAAGGDPGALGPKVELFPGLMDVLGQMFTSGADGCGRGKPGGTAAVGANGNPPAGSGNVLGVSF